MTCAPPDEGGGIETIVVAAIGPAHRLALDGAIMREIVHRHAAARRLHGSDDLLGHRSGVEARRALGGDRVQRGGEIVERDVVAGLRDAAVGPEINARGRWMPGEDRRGDRQRVGDVSADDQALAGERGAGRDELGERELPRAVFAPRELEPGDGPRDADREAAISRFERIGLAVGVEKDVLGRR